MTRFPDRELISRMTRTCSTLYRGGAIYLLKDDVALQTEEQLLSFCLFIAVDERTRLHHLRTLTLLCDPLPQDVTEGLVHIFKRVAHLESLLLLTEGDGFLRSHTDLLDAISGVESLRHLHINSVGRLARDLLKKSRSNLVSLEILFGIMSIHPVSVLAAIAPTLEELIVYYDRTVRHPLHPPAVYPKLPKFVLKTDYPILRPNINAFPNIAQITHKTCHGTH
ncbi:hypothetical protein DICSQDRAFT_164386 [Dichomitus squalens LYAD-421 SS1]|uniref:uncharacterized protein n=1 Tax=Dichomitus squalens (strain LYAD-421) TaxID=732165 RepID=UPI0004415BD8|nr:uncharacterized protein DICSQDRAFT_164386 [Dichomitus squalens LYAD-421 SS1]EJF66542.1 hypothetical protein DICSQDRAFT_164386 [Dichomitus squalens LYAD-421 SS1]